MRLATNTKGTHTVRACVRGSTVLRPTSFCAAGYLRTRHILTQEILRILSNLKVFNMFHVRALQDYGNSRSEPTNAHWQNMFQHILLIAYINNAG